MSKRTEHPIGVAFEKSAYLDVHYLESLPVTVGIENKHPTAILVVESLALRFQSRRSVPNETKADPNTTVLYTGKALSIRPKHLDHLTVEVRPTLLFFGPTNAFDVSIGYRLYAEKVGKLKSFIGEGRFLFIQPAPQMYGKVFISYKEPEDRKLADLLLKFSRDAGFDPYMAPADVKPGSRIWTEKIPKAIKSSKLMFVVWTKNTIKGGGVKRELKFARKHGIKVVPLLEIRAPDPKLFGRDVEYTPFKADDAAVAFAEVVASQR
jgi:hypothetical protein